LANTFATSGANALTLTTTGPTNITLPTTGTLATLAGVETLTGKTINIANNTLTGVQPTLVSGTTIKTVGGQSLLGSGDVSVGVGDVVGPASATADSLARFDGITGKLLKDGAVIGVDVQAQLTPGDGIDITGNVISTSIFTNQTSLAQVQATALCF
jgi:hypothetical protein